MADLQNHVFEYLYRYRASWLAGRIGVNAQTVRDWMRNRYIPELHAEDIELITDGGVTAQEVIEASREGGEILRRMREAKRHG